MTFTANTILDEVNKFGLGFSRSVEFVSDDGQTIHHYGQDGRTVSTDGGATRTFLVQQDSRFHGPTVDAIEKAVFDHLALFNATAATTLATPGPIDVSRFAKTPPPPVTKAQLEAQRAAIAVQSALQFLTSVTAINAAKPGTIDLADQRVADAEKLVTDYASTLLTNQKAATDAQLADLAGQIDVAQAADVIIGK